MSGKPVGDTPQVDNSTTLADMQSGLIIINRNASDGAEVTHFRISDITNGTLYLADGVTQINDGDYITVAQEEAGVRFTPMANSMANGSFAVESSEDGVSVAAQSGAVTSMITVITPPPEEPAETKNPEPEELEEPVEDTLPDVSVTVGDTEAIPPAASPSEGGVLNAISATDDSRKIDGKKEAPEKRDDQDKDMKSPRQSFRKEPAISIMTQEQNILQKIINKPILANAYEHLRNSLDAIKKETVRDIQLNRTVVGSAITASTSLSVGYVVWLVRGGTLLSSVLSSMPAWQIADPLPILTRTKDEEDSDDKESLESIIKKGSRNDDK
jgi:hypothetical protein